MNRKYRKRKTPRFFFIIALTLFLFISRIYTHLKLILDYSTLKPFFKVFYASIPPSIPPPAHNNKVVMTFVPFPSKLR